MNLVINSFVIVCSIFLPICNAETTETPHHCCPGSIIVNARRCKDGNNVTLSCDQYPLLLDPSRTAYQQFSIGKDEDNDGKAYLDAYVAGYHIYQPYFCTGDIHYTYSNRTSSNIAVTCTSNRKWYKDVEVAGSDAIQSARFYRIMAVLSFIFNIGSALLLLTTAAIYYFLPNVQDVQGSCYFFFTLTSGLGHSTFTYLEIFSTEGLLPNMCITNMYLLVYLLLCAMSWSTVNCYHIWRTSMNYQSENEAELLKRYKIFGFGLPFGFIFCAWAYVHITHIANITLSVDCAAHQQVVYGTYVSLPVLTLILLNALMFIHSQIRIWNLHSIQSQDKKLMMKILKYRLYMNAKLFFVMGVPWGLVMLIYIIRNTVEFDDETIISNIQFLAGLLALGEGIPIFLILVIFRKRVLRGIGNKWFANSRIYPDKWKTMRDSETELELSEDETPPKSLETKFTAKNENEVTNTLEDSTIVIL